MACALFAVTLTTPVATGANKTKTRKKTMKNMILKTLDSEGPKSAGQIAELIGEDAESVKIVLAEMLESGAVVKNGAHRYQLPAGAPRSADVAAPCAVADSVVIPPETEYSPASVAFGHQKTLADVLAATVDRLTTEPRKIHNRDEKIEVLTLLAQSVDEPLRALLLSISDDLA